MVLIYLRAVPKVSATFIVVSVNTRWYQNLQANYRTDLTLSIRNWKIWRSCSQKIIPKYPTWLFISPKDKDNEIEWVMLEFLLNKSSVPPYLILCLSILSKQISVSIISVKIKLEGVLQQGLIYLRHNPQRIKIVSYSNSERRHSTL